MKRKKYAFPACLTAEDIRTFRKQGRLTQQELADGIGVSKKTVERWEEGENPITGPVVPLLMILQEQRGLLQSYEIPLRTTPLRLLYMFRRQLCTIIDVDERTQSVEIRNYTKLVQKRAFGRIESPTFEEYEAFLESRCFPRTRDKMKLILKEMNLPFYDL